jgi:hypothetical protein
MVSKRKTMSFKLIQNFITQSESDILLREVDRKLKRLCRNYLENHFDNVITGYKECITGDFNQESKIIFDRIHQQAMDITKKNQLRFNPPHVLDLRDHDSGIGKHVDSLTFGSVICGISLISPCVMIFRDSKSDIEKERVLIPPLSFYVQWDDFRYACSHEIPMTNDTDHSIDGKFIERKRRVSIMFRDIMNERSKNLVAK